MCCSSVEKKQPSHCHGESVGSRVAWEACSYVSWDLYKACSAWAQSTGLLAKVTALAFRLNCLSTPTPRMSCPKVVCVLQEKDLHDKWRHTATSSSKVLICLHCTCALGHYYPMYCNIFLSKWIGPSCLPCTQSLEALTISYVS